MAEDDCRSLFERFCAEAHLTVERFHTFLSGNHERVEFDAMRLVRRLEYRGYDDHVLRFQLHVVEVGGCRQAHLASLFFYLQVAVCYAVGTDNLRLHAPIGGA